MLSDEIGRNGSGRNLRSSETESVAHLYRHMRMANL